MPHILKFSDAHILISGYTHISSGLSDYYVGMGVREEIPSKCSYSSSPLNYSLHDLKVRWTEWGYPPSEAAGRVV